MTTKYLKKASKSATTGEDNTRKIVADMLEEIELHGEEKAGKERCRNFGQSARPRVATGRDGRSVRQEVRRARKACRRARQRPAYL